MTQDEAPRSVADALAAVESMQSQALEQHQKQLAEFDAEIERIQASITNLQAQLTAVQEGRDNADTAFQENGAGGHEEAYHLLFASLRRQSSLLAERNVAWTEAQRALDAQVRKTLEEEGLAQALEDYRATERNPEVLQSLPASYRDAAVAAHKANGERLKARMAELVSVPQVEADALELDVVYAVDGDEEGGVVMLVTPIPDDVHGAWASRDADLLTEVAGRIVQGVYTAVRGTAMESCQAAYGGHQGLLAMEMELPPGSADGFGPKLAEALGEVTSSTQGLEGAGVSLTFTAVQVDRLLPPDDVEEGDDVG